MKQVKDFYPRSVLLALDQIDAEKPSWTLSRKQALRRVMATLACVSVCLLLINYLKNYASLYAIFSILSQVQGQEANYWHLRFVQQPFAELLSYAWWTFWQVVGYVLLPFLFIRYVLRENFWQMGWQWQDTGKHWRGYLLLLSPILVFIALVSQGEDFVEHYPFYDYAGRSWFDLIAWELLYLTQFLCLEFFFRGFFLQALRPAIGANAVWVMCVPYLMIHFPKLWLEATGAILFGLFLGIMALQSRSIWGGFFVHAGVAVTMDLASLFVQGKIPDRWLGF